MLAIGPVAEEWLLNDNTSWKKRYNFLRKTIPSSKLWMSFFVKDPKRQKITLVDEINRETLTEVATSFLDSDEHHLPTDSEETEEDDADDIYYTDAGPSGQPPRGSILHFKGNRNSSIHFKNQYRSDSTWTTAHKQYRADSTWTFAHFRSSIAGQRNNRRLSSMPYSVMTALEGPPSNSTSGSNTPLIQPTEFHSDADAEDDESSSSEHDFKTHEPPKPVFFGVQQGEASRNLHAVWANSLPRSQTNWRENMERLIAQSPQPTTGSVASPRTIPPSVAAPSTIVDSPSTIRAPVPADRRVSTRSYLSSLVNVAYDTVRSRGSTASVSSSLAPSFVTANESIEYSTDRRSMESTDMLLNPAEEVYDPTDARPSSSLPNNPTTDYESTIQQEERSWPEARQWTDPFETSTIQRRPSLAATESWGPPAPDELSAFSDEEPDQSGSESPLAASRLPHSRSKYLADIRARLNSSVEGPSTQNSYKKSNRRSKYIDLGLSRYLKRKKKGEVVRAEKLLVMVKGSKARFINHDFNEMEYVETRVLERWKEYVVVARNTGEHDAPILLQFHSSPDITRVDPQTTKRVSKIDIKLTSDMYVKFYSTLDKTIVLWRSTSKGSLLYILRARSHETSLRWLALFRRALGVQQMSKIVLGVPSLDVTMELVVPWAQFYREQAKHNAVQKDKKLISYQDMKSNIARANPITSYIFTTLIQGLSRIDHFRDEIAELVRCEKMGLAWRRYDRLEWVNEGNEEGIYCSWVLRKTHDLEFRPKKAYPTVVTFEDGAEMEEPVPVEGFLVRLTTWLGNGRQRPPQLHKLFYKKLYFHTHDNILFFSLPQNAVPPHPSGATPTDPDGLPQGSPLDYEVAPFKTDENGEIEWLQGNSNEEEVKRHDRAAFYETQRRAAMIVGADGFIDLCEIDQVRIVERDNEGTDFNMSNENDPLLQSCFATDSHETGDISGYSDSNVFEIIMLSGLIIRLQAFNEYTRDRWIQKLTEMAKYWKQRVYEDVARINEVRLANLERLHVDEDIEPFVGEASPKWETSSGVADSSVFHISRISWSRSISMRGILYQKASRHASFRRFYVVLCHGHIILYSVYYRAPTGDAKHRADHRRYQTLGLDNCYVYSGPITQGDLAHWRERWFDRTNPASKAIPRVYPDGWKSAEDEAYRCFVLWTNGKPMTFLARSRQERDIWVMALNNEIEQIVESSVTQDIRIVA